MIQFDIIMVSDATDVIRREVTQRCIDSIFRTQEDGYEFKVIVVEANKHISYDDCITVHYDFDFNYNKCLNLGLRYSMARYKGLCNNDLIFHYGWAKELIRAFDKGFGSVSPYCMNTHKDFFPMGRHLFKGYRIGAHVAGWAIFVTDKTIESIGKLNEGVVFWYSDNIYVEQIRSKSIQHCIVCSSFVTHLGSNTLNRIINKTVKREMTIKQKRAYENQKKIIWRGKKETPYVINEEDTEKVVTLKR
jgi:hypothetical protein